MKWKVLLIRKSGNVTVMHFDELPHPELRTMDMEKPQNIDWGTADGEMPKPRVDTVRFKIYARLEQTLFYEEL